MVNLKRFKVPLLMVLMTSLLVMSACSHRHGLNPDGNEPLSPLSTENIHNDVDNRYRLLSQQRDHVNIPVVIHEGKEYVSINRIVEVLNFKKKLDKDEQSISFGDNDIAYKLFFDVNQMEKEEENVILDDSPIVLEGQPMLPTTLIKTVFGDAMTYHLAQKELIIYSNGSDLSRNHMLIDAADDHQIDSLSFEEDPNDPFKDVDIEQLLKGDESTSTDAQETWGTYESFSDSDVLQAATIKNINIPGMIKYGKKYLGVKYEFGAAPYRKSKRFDCSSFTKHVYKTYGVKLRRISRNQVKQGVAVSRKSLRKGDLLFFYVPGRFKSNKTIGHVGIYIGKNKMLHSSPEPKDGVQITNINKRFWKDTFIKARRVVK